MQVGSDGETCWTLVRLAAGGDGAARSSFGRTYLPLVRSFLNGRWRGTPLTAQIDDAVQDVFVECFRPGGPLSRAESGAGEFRGFLFGIVRNVALRIEERARAAPPREPTGSQLDDLSDPASRASQVFDREWAQMLMREAGDLMQRRAADEGAQMRVELLRLRFGADVPIREIAARWKLDADAVHRAYARAREEFRLCLRQVVAFHAVRTESELDDECRRLFAMLA